MPEVSVDGATHVTVPITTRSVLLNEGRVAWLLGRTRNKSSLHPLGIKHEAFSCLEAEEGRRKLRLSPGSIGA
jgi:hypothetical protein